MHARELIDLAALVAAEGVGMVRGVKRLSPGLLVRYWTAVRVRCDRWQRALAELRDSSADERLTCEEQWTVVQPICGEVLAAEMLTRVWGSVLASLTDTAGEDGLPVAHATLRAHVETSNRVLNLLSSPRVPRQWGAELNRTRRLTERWTDLLLGRLAGQADISPFAHDVARAHDFADDFAQPHGGPLGRQAWALLTTSLRGAFHARLATTTGNEPWNANVAGAILACLPAEHFDAVGVYQSWWQLRLTATAADTQVLVDELLSIGAVTCAPNQPMFLHAGGPRRI